jgi:hypothetical protein
MGEHAEAANDSERESHTKRAEVDWRKTKDHAVVFLAALARWIGLIFAAFLVLHVVFVLGNANAANGIVSFVTGWAESASLGFRDLFTPSDAKLRVLVNYGVAAVFWLVVSAVVGKLIRRIGGVGTL